MENNEQNLSFKITLDTSGATKGKAEVVSAFSGMGQAIITLGNVGTDNLQKISKEAQDAAAHVSNVAKGLGMEVRELMSVLEYYRKMENQIQQTNKVEEAANARRIKDSELLTQKLERDAESLLQSNLRRYEEDRKNWKFIQDAKMKSIENNNRIENQYERDRIKSTEKMRDEEMNNLLAGLNKQTNAIKNAKKTQLEQTLEKSINGRFGNQFSNVSSNLMGSGGFGGFAANLANTNGGGGGFLSTIIGSTVRGASMGAEASEGSTMGLLGGAAGGLAVGALTAGIGLLIAAFSALLPVIKEGAHALFDYSASLEQTRIGFVTLLGDAEKADSFIRSLQKFASETPFDFKGVADASRKLLAMGQDAASIMPEITAIGNAVSAIGGDDENFQRIVKAFADIHARSKLTGEEIRQLANNLIPVIPILSKELGKSSQEIMKMTRDGKISADLFVDAFEHFVQKNWGDAMEKQSKTFLGSMNNVKDMLFVIGSDAFAPIFDAISKFAQKLNDAFKGADGVEGILDRAVAVFSYYGGYFGAKLIDGFISYVTDPSTYVKILSAIGNSFANIALGVADAGRDAGAKYAGKSVNKDDYLGSTFLTGDKAPDNKLMIDAMKKRSDLAKQLKDQMALLEEEGAKEQSQINKKMLDDQLGVVGDYYKIQESKLAVHLAFNRQQESFYDQADTNLKLANLNAQTDLTKLYFKKEEEINVANSSKLIELGYEKNNALNKIETERETIKLALDKRNLERGYADFEERRNALLKFTSDRISVVQFGMEKENREIEKAMKNGSTIYNEGFAELRNLAFKSFEEIRNQTAGQFDVQLMDLKLTEDQKANIRNEKNLAIEQLTENHVQNLLSIEQRGWQQSEDNLKNHISQMKSLRSAESDSFASIASLVNSGTFNSRTTDQLNNALGISGLVEPRTNLMNRMSEQTGLFNKFQEQQTGVVNRFNALPDKDKTDSIYQSMSDGYDALQAKMEKATEEYNSIKEKLSDLTAGVPEQFFKISEITSEMLGGKRGIEGFDEISKSLLDIKHTFENANLETDIGLIHDLLDLETKKGDNKSAERLAELNAELTKLTADKTTQAIRQQSEEIERYNNSFAGLAERFNNLKSGDRGTVLGIADKTTRDVMKERNGLLEENISLEARLGMVTDDSADHYRNAWLKAMYDVKNEANIVAEAQAKADVMISRQTTFNAQSARAQIAEHMAQAKGYTEIFADSFTSMSDSIADGFANVFGKVNEHLGVFGRTLTDISTSLFKLVTNQLIMKLVDWMTGGSSGNGNGMGSVIGGIGNQSGAGSGSVASGIAGVAGLGGMSAGNLIKAVMSRAGTSGTLPTGSVFNGINSETGAIEQMMQVNGNDPIGSTITTSQTLSGQAANALGISGNLPKGFGSIFQNGKFSLSGLGQAISPMLPVAGLSLGSRLGQGNLGASILGGAGGLALGGLSALGILSATGAFATGGLFATGGALAGFGGIAGGLLAAAPIIAPIAAVALLASYFIGRSSKQKANEKLRTQYLQEYGGQLDQLLSDVKSHKVGADQGLAQAEQIRSAYLQQASTISDSKTKRIAIQEANETNGQIYRKVDLIRNAAQIAANQNSYFNKLVPEFATGGTILGQLGSAQLVIAHAGERIINRRQQTPEVMSALAEAGVPNTSSLAGTSGTGSSRNNVISVELSLGTSTQNQLFVNGAKSDQGFKVLVQSNNKARESRAI